MRPYATIVFIVYLPHAVFGTGLSSHYYYYLHFSEEETKAEFDQCTVGHN
jgi:hypothetical protein